MKIRNPDTGLPVLPRRSDFIACSFFTFLFVAKIIIAPGVIPRYVPVITGNGIFLIIGITLCLAGAIPRFRSLKFSLPVFIGVKLFLLTEAWFFLPAVVSARPMPAVFFTICILQVSGGLGYAVLFFPYPAAGLSLVMAVLYDLLINRRLKNMPPVFIIFLLITTVFVACVFLLLRVVRSQHLKEKTLLSNQRDLALKLHEAREKLMEQQKYTTIAAFTAGIAHELGNPINHMKGNLTFLKEYSETIFNYIRKSDTSAQRYAADQNRILEDWETILNSMDKGFERITETITSLKNVIRNTNEAPVHTDLADILESAMDYTAINSKSRIRVVKTVERPLFFSCQPGDFFSIFQNILTNAEEASAVRDNGLVSVVAGFRDENIVISIEDNGLGIKAEYRERIFEPFYTTKDLSSNMGIGLTLCKIFVERYGGNISVDSDGKSWSRCTIILPGRKK